MNATLMRQLERARQQLRGLVAPLVVPSPVELFRMAFGDPDPWQVQALQSTAQRLSFNVSRQLGKSSVAATLGTHRALAVPGSLVLLVSPSLRQSVELFRKVLDCYRAAGSPIPPDSETKLTLELASGSRIVSLPGREGTIRGYSGVSLLLLDEASRCPDELYYSVRPMLAVSGGRLVTLSTPWGARGWWWREWIEGGTVWDRYEVNAEQCPRISPEFLAEERRSLGDLVYQSEYLCRFVDTEDQAFRSSDIEAALDPSVTPLFARAS